MTDVTVDALGHRERKKQRTRETIARVALELFVRQGYQETTIAQIAEAADVSPRTVSAYFPAKEQLVYADAEAFLDALDARLTDRLEGETAIDALRVWLLGFLEGESSQDTKRRLCVQDLADSDATLRAYDRALHARAAACVSRAVAVDLGEPADALLPHMVGVATMSALDALGRNKGSRSPEELEAESVALIDDTMAFVAAGVRELAQRRG